MEFPDIVLEKRSEQTTALEPEQFDDNMTKTEAAIAKLNALARAISQFGEMYFTGNAIATSCASSATDYVVEGVLAAGQCNLVTFLVDNSSLVLPAGTWIVEAVASFAGISAHSYRFAFALDGTVDAHHIGRVAVASTDTRVVAVVGILTTTEGQKLTIMVRDEAGTGNVTISDLTVIARRVA